ncbi:MAG: hypothetical protein KAR15_10670 [Desulfobacterales bacterium]|nr:hypothetical protein [Desulfobacterales bacterium]
MNLEKAIKSDDFIFAEASVIEALRRSGRVNLHPRLEHLGYIVENIQGS